MPRGQPDYGVYASKAEGATLSDIGELAARLGSIATFDRRGDVVFLDDFESPVIRWDRFNAFGGTYPILSSNFALSGAQSIYLHCAAQTNSYSRITRGNGLIETGKIGVEYWLQGTGQTSAYVESLIEVSDGVNLTKARVKYDILSGTINITTPTGDIEIATGIYMIENLNYFIPIKSVMDMDTDYYVRLLVGGEEIDLSSYALVDSGATSDKIINIYFTLYGVAAGETKVYIDNVIFTFNEP